MKQVSIEKFSGLQIQPNSFTTSPGSLQRAENVLLSQDYLITKRRGYKKAFEMPSGQILNRLFDYNGYVWAVSQNTLYRLIQTPVAATATSFAASPLITVRKTAHGLRNGDSVSEIEVLNTDAFNGAFPNRHVDFAGTRTVTTEFNLTTASRSTNVITVTLNNHGMQIGDTISVSASTLSVTSGTYTVTGVSTNTFTFASVGSNGSGTVSFSMVDAFRYSASSNAISGVTTASNAFFYIHYVVQGGESFTVSSNGVGVSRVVKSNKNAYFTADNGILKLERFDLPIRKAGIVPGLDLNVSLGRSDGGTGNLLGPVKPQYSLAYRILFGRKDANGNLILGAPSQFALVSNAQLFTIGNANLSYNSGTQQLTITQAGHGHVAGESIYLYNCSGFTPAIPNGSRVQVVSATSGAFVVDLSPLGIASVTTLEISYGNELTPLVTFTVPDEVSSTEFIYRIYRTDQVEGPTATPDPNTYKLVQEANLTQLQIDINYVDFYDSLDDVLIEGNVALYTNPNQEGELQSNDRPPRGLDAALFKNYVFYANTTQYRNLEFAVVAPSQISGGDILTIGGQQYLFRGNAGNDQIGNQRLTSPAVGAGPVTITQFGHGFQNGDIIVVNGSSGIAGFSPGLGTYAVFGVTANTFNIGGSGASGSGTVTYEGLTDASGRRLVKLLVPGASSGVTLSEAIDQTARYIVKAINRNNTSGVYGIYTSGLTGAPGKMFLTSKGITTPAYTLTISNAAASDAFLPSVPTSGSTVEGVQDSFPNQLLVSKVGEPEAVPLTNSFNVGSEEAEILRIAALRDSLIILKEDGVFRLNGDSLNNFTVTALDTTVICKATDSVDVLNNSVYAFTNQGVVQITDASVRILSRPIEPVLSAILGTADLESVTSGISYESERLYLLATIRPNTTSTVADAIYVYNYLSDTWALWTGANLAFVNGLVSTLDDKMLAIPAGDTNVVVKERKDNTNVDYSEQEYPVLTINGVIANFTTLSGSADVTVTSQMDHAFEIGDLVTISRGATALGSAFPGGLTDVEGLREITAVDNGKIFSFAAATNATVSLTARAFYKEWICELDVSATTLSGSRVVSVTTSLPHQLASGDSINVNSLGATVSGAFSAASDVTGFRSLTVTGPTTFTFNATNNATSGVTGPINITDKRQDRTLCTLDVNGIAPQSGDIVVFGNDLLKIRTVLRYSTQFFLVDFATANPTLSTDSTYLHTAYKSVVKWNPLTLGNTSQLKYFPEFQTSFRTQTSCSAATVSFSNDSTPGSTPVFWNTDVGTDRTPVNFGGWGQLNWGEFPWGGDPSIDKEFVTTSAVILRIYVPKETFVGTYIQPTIEHRVGGEPLEIQSVGLLTRPVTERTTK